MQDCDESWVIWNGLLGIVTTATIGRVETSPMGPQAWMNHPFEMLGPLDLNALKSQGCLTFAACIVMSHQRWQDDQVALRQQAQAQRRAAHQRRQEEQARHHHANGYTEGRRRHRTQSGPLDESQHRAILNLPRQGPLEPAQIKTAFRRLAQKAHPDMGGSQDLFVRLTDARNALLAQLAG